MAAALAVVSSSAQAACGQFTTCYVGDTLTLTVPVTASVGGRCFFASGEAPQGTYDIPGFIDTTTWSKDFEFTIDCNTASRVGVVSTNGGLKTAGTITDPGYLGLAPYEVALFLDGNLVDASGNCSAASLLASAGTPCTFRGPAAPGQGMALLSPSKDQSGSKLTVSAPAYSTTPAGASTTLVSGSYTDTLTITIAAVP